MITANKRRTKVIWSLDGACLTDDKLAMVGTEDVDALRLVYAPEGMSKILSFLQKKNADPKAAAVPVMIDIATRVRATLSNLTNPMEVVFGQKLSISSEKGLGDLKVKTDVWADLFKPKISVYFGYGNAVARVKKISSDLIDIEIIQGGTLYPNMGLHIPDTQPDTHLSDIPVEDIKAALRSGIDFIVVPGIASVADITDLKNLLAKESTTPPWLILKINSERVYNKLEDLLPHVDGVLISRLEMALGMNPATIPMLTKEIIQLCNDRSKIVCTASEMLGSMRHNATPTRAEVSDIANSVIDGTDAVVLSEEVSNGAYSARALQLMRLTIEDIEEQHSAAPNWLKLSPTIESEMDAVAYTAYKTALRIHAKAIVCITVAGNTAVRLATFRASMPIIATTFSSPVLRKLRLVRGVEGIFIDVDPKIDEVLPTVNDRLVRDSWLKAGDRIVFVSITLSSVGRQASNLLTVQTLT